MGFAVTEMAFSPPLSTPITYDHWMEITQSLGECVESRQIQWLCSLVSVQGDRSLCVYQVPYTDAVREAYREAGMPFQQAWQADLWVDYDPASLPQGDTLIMVDVNYEIPITKATYESHKQRAANCFHEMQIEHIVSAVALDGTHSICVFSAPTAEDVRSLYRKLCVPFGQVWKATLIRPSSAA